MIENGRPVLGAAIHKLSTGIRGIHLAPEYPQQFVVSDLSRIIDDLNRLRMPGSTGTDFSISGVIRMSSRISGYGRDDTVVFFKIRFHTPETTAGKCGFRKFTICLVHGYARFLFQVFFL